MRKKPTPPSRRLNLDPLENRCLLSGGFELIEVRPAPALVLGIDARQIPLPVAGLGRLAISSLTSNAGNWAIPVPHHDLASIDVQTAVPEVSHAAGELAINPAVVPLGSDPAVVPLGSYSVELSAPPSVGGLPAAGSVGESSGSAPGAIVHSELGMPFQGYPASPILFLAEDIGRFLRAERDLSFKPPGPPGLLWIESTASPAAETTQSDSEGVTPEGVTVAPAAGQATGLAQGEQFHRPNSTLRCHCPRTSDGTLQCGICF